KVVGRSLPFHCTTELSKKLNPSTPKVKASPPTVAPLGLRAVIVGMGFVPLVMMVTAAVAALVGSATDVAVTVRVGGVGGVPGAVYFPVASIVPQLAPVQSMAETLQVTAWSAPLGLTVAVNCCTPPG